MWQPGSLGISGVGDRAESTPWGLWPKPQLFAGTVDLLGEPSQPHPSCTSSQSVAAQNQPGEGVSRGFIYHVLAMCNAPFHPNLRPLPLLLCYVAAWCCLLLEAHPDCHPGCTLLKIPPHSPML